MKKELNVLLVEDSEDDSQLVMRFVKRFVPNAKSLRVETEESMIRALKDQSWDLIISDYNLPTFSGAEAIKVMKAYQSETPLIIVSGTIGEESATEVVKQGAIDYVLKGNLGRLPTAIERALREAKANKALVKMQQNYTQTKKMETVGRFAGGLAHDVNNVLTAITLYAQMSLRKLDKDPNAAKTNIEAILNATKNASEIIKQVLIFSRQKDETSNEVLDVGLVLKNFRTILKHILGSQIELIIEEAIEPMLIYTSKTQVEQVLLNLSSNAKDAMATNGRITLSLERQDISEVPLHLQIPIPMGSYIVLRVTDNGHGMTEEVAQQIFEPYFTTKLSDKGTGLGLSVVYAIMQQCKGSVGVESTPGQGTSMYIYWPVAYAEN